ncbi:hypothetical protein F5B18DRAFT_462317 [Nemania serpens]|nr:hypothetical protein F5B18DRAFT_462317 [Nemania serpens]
MSLILSNFPLLLQMPFSRLDMDHDLLGMGSWIDDRAASQPSTTQSQERGSVRHYLPPLAETDRHGSFFKGAEHIESSRGSHESEHSKSEDKLADGTTRDAIGEIRVTQTVTVDGRQRGNKATAKPSRAPSVVERQLLKQARVYLPLDEYEGMHYYTQYLTWHAS